MDEGYENRMMEKYELIESRSKSPTYDMNKLKRFDVETLEHNLMSIIPRYVTDTIYNHRYLIGGILIFRSFLRGYSKLDGATLKNTC